VWPFIFPGGASFFAEDPAVSIPDNKGLGQLHELIHKERVAPIQCSAWDSLALWQRFADRRDIAMAPWGIWAIPKLRTLEDFEFDALPYPSASGSRAEAGPAKAFIGTAGFIVLRQPDPVKRKLCMEFARFLVRADEQAQLARYGVFPSRASAGNIYGDDEMMAKAQRVVEWAKMDEKLQREMQLALLNEKTVDAALADAAEQIRGILPRREAPAALAPSDKAEERMPVMLAAILALAAGLIACLLLAARRSGRASAFVFLGPALSVFAVFMLFPLFWVGALSFQDYSISDGVSRWVGLDNLRAVLGDQVFVRASLNTLIYAAVVVPLNTFSALVIASLIYPLSNRARSFFRGAYYLPGVASVVVIAMVWRWMFNEDFGLLNAGLGFLGLPGIRWLSDPDLALWSVILTAVARPPGGPILIYLAALDAIPTSLYDAGKIDGAGPLRRWRHITVPLLRPTTLFLALTITIASFQVFAQVLILTDGGPGYASEVIVHRIYTAAIRDFDFGMAAAMSLILFVVIAIVSAAQYRFFRSEVEY
jgi:multiple sugar transport system permease protein